MKKKVKWIILVFLALILIIYGIYYSTKPLEVSSIEIVPKTVSKSFTEEGKIIVTDEKTLFSPLSGEIDKINVKENQTVKKGDLILTYNTQEMQYNLNQLNAQLQSVKGQELQTYKSPYPSQIEQQKLMIEQARLQKQTAENELKKIKVLYEQGAISKSSYEEAKRTVTTAQNLLSQQEQALQILKDQYNVPQGTAQYFEGQKQVIQAQIELIQYQMSKAQLVSPIDGIVTTLNAKENMVTAPGTPLITIMNPNKLETEVFVLTEDILSIKENMPVEMALESNDKSIIIKGKIKEIAPSAQETISALGLAEQRIRVNVIPEKSAIPLKPGYALDVKFTTFKEDNCISVPKTSLFPYENKDAVWIIHNGSAQIVQVETGLETDQEIVVTKGLKKGDIIIVNPQTEGLKENKKVYSVFVTK